MMARIPMPRLLPATICVIAFVLAVKCTGLVQSAMLSGQPVAMIAAAWSAGTDPAAAKTGTDKTGADKTGADKTGADKTGATPTARVPEKKTDAPETAKSEDKPPPREGPPPISDGERAVLMELRERHKELEAREASLSARESLLAATEMKLSSRVEELRTLQQKLESLEAGRKQQEDIAWQGLVKVYETMKPRDAAAIFNDLGMPVLIAVVDRMKEAKAAAILAAMTPDKAREVTTQLAAVRSRSSVVTGNKPMISADPGKAPGSGT
jgi:flagellar motility protein MotE (MotC chaperone)